MTTLLNSFLLVGLSEMGDKTQLLALMLAGTYRKPWPIMAGIIVATILNHLLAAALGQWAAQVVDSNILKYILVITFIAFAVWMLIPDREDEVKAQPRWGVFMTTVILFFLAEVGDKTQLSTVALAARYNDMLWVTAGTTLGMVAADGLAVVFGDRLTKFISMKWMRRIAALCFLITAIVLLFQ